MRVTQDQSADSYSLPAPTGGWNARDPLDMMPPEDAVELINAFPDTNKVTTRNGFTVWQDETHAIGFLTEYTEIDGTRTLIGGMNGNIYDFSSLGAPAALGGGGAFTNNQWQTASFLGQIVFVNGSDQPQKYDGSTFGNANYTGITDDSVFINISLYRNRLYFVEKDSTSVWYTSSASVVTGAVTEFDFSDMLKRGGYLVFAGSLSHDTGNGLQDIFIVISSEGEVLAYTGTHAGHSDWAIAGRYFMPKPLGKYRCAINMYGDLMVITETGVYPMSQILSPDNNEQDAITNKIQNAFNAAARVYSDNNGWSGLFAPKQKWVLFNIPVSATVSHQYVMNSLTGSWCKFTGMNASCWTLFNGNPFFGTASGAIMKADNGTNDNGAAINVSIQQAFNYFDNRENVKQFLQLRPLILASGNIELELGINVDNRSDGEFSTVGTEDASGADWDDSDWDVDDWAGGDIDVSTWETICGIGRSASIKMRTSLTAVNFSLTASHITFRTGGII